MSNYDALLRSYGPSAWWKLDDPVGSTSVRDWSGNGYTGIVNGGVTFGQPGPMAGAPQDTGALFDGTSGHIATAYQPDFTVCSALAWYKTTTDTGNLDILDTGAVSNSAGIALELRNGEFTPRVNGNYYNPEPFDSADGNWHFVVMTYDGNTVRGYRDGSEVVSYALTGTIASAYAALLGSTVGLDWFPGAIAQVAVFPYALSAAQVAALWSPPSLVSGGSGFPKLVGR